MAKTEDIEAKLAAYVDGELDAAGRAQIEQHLADHPEHRGLIHDLMQQKQMLSALPRQPAPPEVAETFNAQLERAVLLGDVDGDADRGPVLRIGFASHLRAIAAMLILTGGLAGLIWYLLPTGSHTPQLADLQPSPSAATVAPSAAPASNPMDLPLVAPEEFDNVIARLQAEDQTAKGSATSQPIELAESTRAMAAGPVGQRGGGGGGRGGGGGFALSLPADDADRFKAAAPLAPAKPADVEMANDQKPAGIALFDQLKLGPPSPAFMYVFSTDNPDVTNQQVTTYLTRNGITWENESEPMPQPLNLAQSQTGFASRLGQQSVVMKSQSQQQSANDPAAQAPATPPASNRIIARQLPRSRAVDVMAGLDKMQSQATVEPFTVKMDVSAAKQQTKDIAASPRQIARADGLMASNAMPRDEMPSSPTTLPLPAVNFAPDFDLPAAVLGPPATQQADQPALESPRLLRKEQLSPLPQQQDLVDMVIVVQSNELVPTTQPQP